MSSWPFSNSKTWLFLHHSPPLVSWHRAVWPKVRIPKHLFLHWVVLRDRLLTRDQLRSWGLNVLAECLLCGSNSESRSHLLFHCDFSTEVINSFFTHIDINPPLLLEDIVAFTTRKYAHLRGEFATTL